MTPVRQFAILCYIQIVLIIAGAAGIIQIAETSNNPLSVTHTGDWTFFNSFFNSVLVFVTIQTPPADNVLSKIFVAVLVIVLILIVPYQISQVLDLGKSFSQYQLASFVPTSRAKAHCALRRPHTFAHRPLLPRGLPRRPRRRRHQRRRAL
ncbi:hypothetical protein PINS_up014601 [Pythium insidiosum]|nr:hypothetical protein PINS_up014601 [Pythium insidiosum]